MPLNIKISFPINLKISDVVSTTIRFVIEFRVDWWYFCPTTMKIFHSLPQNDDFFDKVVDQVIKLICPQFGNMFLCIFFMYVNFLRFFTGV